MTNRNTFLILPILVLDWALNQRISTIPFGGFQPWRHLGGRMFSMHERASQWLFIG
jgi:hypothetical protein